MKRFLIAILAIITLTTLLSAQQRRMGPPQPGEAGPGPMQRPDPTAGLKAALNLTDAQVDSIKALLQTRRERSKAIESDIMAKRKALDALLNATTQDPAAVGNAAIALHGSEVKMEGERDWFLTELKKLLTGEQQQTLDRLIAARSPIPGLFGPGFGPRGGPRGPRG